MPATSRRRARGIAIAITAAVLAVPSLSYAQFEDENEEERREKQVHESMGEELTKPTKASLGVGLRLRYVFFPKSLIELFVEEASSGIARPGFGLEFIRKKNDFSIHIGIEHENTSPDTGRWLEKGDDAVSAGQAPDNVIFDDKLSWTTVDAQFMFHKNLAKGFDFRYGAGFGIGYVHGHNDIDEVDQMCDADTTPETINDGKCRDDPGGITEKANIPPVFPVVNIAIGVHYSPIRNLSFFLEGGMRSLFYAGLGTAYFF